MKTMKKWFWVMCFCLLAAGFFRFGTPVEAAAVAESPKPQAIYIDGGSYDYVKADKVFTSPGEEVCLFVTPPDGKELDYIQLETLRDGHYETWTQIPGVRGQKEYSFTTLNETGTCFYVKPMFKDLARSAVRAHIDPVEGGTVTGTGGYYPGETVTLTVQPRDAYELESMTASSNVTLTQDPANANIFIFTMPNGQVDVYPKFKEKAVVTYRIVGGYWADGSKEEKKEPVSKGQAPARIPEVGGADDGYGENGSWDVDPAGQTINGNEIFTYSFTKMYIVIYEIKNGTWADGTTAAKDETVLAGETPTEVPTGMLPSSGFEGSGQWLFDPADTVIMCDQRFTWFFGEDSSCPMLKTMTVEGATLSPSFSPGLTRYYVTVPGDTESVTITAEAMNAGTTAVKGDVGSQTLGFGENHFLVTAAAENQSSRLDYQITILRERKETEIWDLSYPRLVDADESIDVRFNIKEKISGNPVEDAYPWILIDGGSNKELFYNTDEDAFCVSLECSEPGTHSLEIIFNQTSEYAPCRAVFEVTVRERISLHLDDLKPAIAHPGKPYTISGILRDADDLPAANVSGRVFVPRDISDSICESYSFTTDAHGAFSVYVTERLPAGEGSLKTEINVSADEEIRVMGESHNIDFSENNHEWGPWTVTTPAAPGQEGVETRVCIYDVSHTETSTLTVHTVTYEIENGSWTKEGGTTITEIVRNGELPAHIPDDMVPDEGYGNGQWKGSIPSGNKIYADTTYTWSYRLLEPHTISLYSPMEHGTIILSKTKAVEGEIISLNPVPDEGYGVYDVAVDAPYGYAVWVENNTIRMPDANVTVRAWFLPIISYVDETGTEQTTLAWPLDETKTILLNDWYAVTEDIEITQDLRIFGDVYLVLCDGATLTLGNSETDYARITLEENCSLTVYGQSKGSGTILAKTRGTNEIFTYRYWDRKEDYGPTSVTMNGGVIAAEVGGSVYAHQITVNRGELRN